jgi:hypothetical protein
MMKVPAEKNANYFIVSLLVMIAATIVLTFAMTAILIGKGFGYYNGFNGIF